MNEKSKLIVLIALIVTALVVYLSFYSPFRPAPGAGGQNDGSLHRLRLPRRDHARSGDQKGRGVFGRNGLEYQVPPVWRPGPGFQPAQSHHHPPITAMTSLNSLRPAVGPLQKKASVNLTVAATMHVPINRPVLQRSVKQPQIPVRNRPF